MAIFFLRAMPKFPIPYPYLKRRSRPKCHDFTADVHEDDYGAKHEDQYDHNDHELKRRPEQKCGSPPTTTSAMILCSSVGANAALHFLQIVEFCNPGFRVAEVAREHGWHPPKSLDSDENFKPRHMIFSRKLKFVAIYALIFGDLWAKKCLFG